MNCRGRVSTEITSWVFCAVSATIADVPCTPQRANAFRSAWMPAPPPESEVAMVIATAGDRSPDTAHRLDGAIRETLGDVGLTMARLDTTQKVGAGITPFHT